MLKNNHITPIKFVESGLYVLRNILFNNVDVAPFIISCYEIN